MNTGHSGKLSLWGDGGKLGTCHPVGQAPNQTFWHRGAALWGLSAKESPKILKYWGDEVSVYSQGEKDSPNSFPNQLEMEEKGR